MTPAGAFLQSWRWEVNENFCSHCWLYCLIKKQGQQICCSYRKARAAISTVAVRAMRIRRKNWELFSFLLCFWLSFWLSLPTPGVDPSSLPIMWDGRKLWGLGLTTACFQLWCLTQINHCLHWYHGFSEAILAIFLLLAGANNTPVPAAMFSFGVSGQNLKIQERPFHHRLLKRHQ